MDGTDRANLDHPARDASGEGRPSPSGGRGPRRPGAQEAEPGGSEIPYRHVPEHPWSRLLLAASLAVVVGVIGWEMFARSMHHTPGSYDDTGESWAIERRKLDDSDGDVRAVLAGSSRMLWAADLDILEEGLGTRPVQLALPGTSPRIIVEHLVNTTDFDGLILVGYTPFLFNSPGPGGMGQVSLDAYTENSPSKRLGYLIHRRLSDQLAFIDGAAFALFKLLERYASPRLTSRADARDLNALEWKLGNLSTDRQMDMWEPAETPGTFDWQQMINFWRGQNGEMSPPPPVERQAEMAQSAVDFFRPLVSEMRSRGGDIVFIRMPSSGEYLEREREGDVDTHLWTPHVEGLDALSINGWDYPELSTDLEIPEWSHLSRRSQDDWSRALVPILQDRYWQFRGERLHEVLGIREPEPTVSTEPSE